MNEFDAMRLPVNAHRREQHHVRRLRTALRGRCVHRPFTGEAPLAEVCAGWLRSEVEAGEVEYILTYTAARDGECAHGICMRRGTEAGLAARASDAEELADDSDSDSHATSPDTSRSDTSSSSSSSSSWYRTGGAPCELRIVRLIGGVLLAIARRSVLRVASRVDACSSESVCPSLVVGLSGVRASTECGSHSCTRNRRTCHYTHNHATSQHESIIQC
jgi:hypothetical protein